MLNVGGDATYYLGDYMALLSSEYKLLKQNSQTNPNYHQDEQATLNKLYFAIMAIDRLDSFGEVHLYYQKYFGNTKNIFTFTL